MDVTAEQILEMEDARCAAMIDDDIAALERVSADDLGRAKLPGMRSENVAKTDE